MADVKTQAIAWMEKNVADIALRGRALGVVNTIGDRANGSELLDHLSEAFATVDPNVAKLVEICSHPRNPPGPAGLRLADRC